MKSLGLPAELGFQIIKARFNSQYLTLDRYIATAELRFARTASAHCRHAAKQLPDRYRRVAMYRLASMHASEWVKVGVRSRLCVDLTVHLHSISGLAVAES